MEARGSEEWIRTAARAVIVRDGRILLTHCRDASGEWFSAPGGGQAVGETLPETVARECREELGAEVVVGELLFVRDYIGAEHEFTYVIEAPHQVEHFFACAVAADYEPAVGHGGDTAQIGVEWLDAAALAEARVYPACLRDLLHDERCARVRGYVRDPVG